MARQDVVDGVGVNHPVGCVLGTHLFSRGGYGHRLTLKLLNESHLAFVSTLFVELDFPSPTPSIAIDGHTL